MRLRCAADPGLLIQGRAGKLREFCDAVCRRRFNNKERALRGAIVYDILMVCGFEREKARPSARLVAAMPDGLGVPRNLPIDATAAAGEAGMRSKKFVLGTRTSALAKIGTDVPAECAERAPCQIMTQAYRRAEHTGVATHHRNCRRGRSDRGPYANGCIERSFANSPTRAKEGGGARRCATLMPLVTSPRPRHRARLPATRGRPRLRWTMAYETATSICAVRGAR